MNVTMVIVYPHFTTADRPTRIMNFFNIPYHFMSFNKKGWHMDTQELTSPKVPRKKKRRPEPIMGALKIRHFGRSSPRIRPLPPIGERPRTITIDHGGTHGSQGATYGILWNRELKDYQVLWGNAYISANVHGPDMIGKYMVVVYGFHTHMVDTLERIGKFDGMLPYYGYTDIGDHRYVVFGRYHLDLHTQMEMVHRRLTWEMAISVIKRLLWIMNGLFKKSVYFNEYFSGRWGVIYSRIPFRLWPGLNDADIEAMNIGEGSMKIVFTGFLREEDIHMPWNTEEVERPFLFGYDEPTVTTGTGFMSMVAHILLLQFAPIVPPEIDFGEPLFDLMNHRIHELGEFMRVHFGKYPNSQETIEFFLRAVNLAKTYWKTWPSLVYKDHFLHEQSTWPKHIGKLGHVLYTRTSL